MQDDRTVPLKALQKAREQNKLLRTELSTLQEERANVQAFLRQLGFSISAACASIFTREG
jgi:hypothetical protein